MSSPLHSPFRNEQVPQVPAFYVDTDPNGRHIDPMMAVGSVAVLEKITNAVEVAGISAPIVNDLRYRIGIEKGDVKPTEDYEDVDPCLLTGQEAWEVRGKLDEVLSGKHPEVGMVAKMRLRSVARHMLRRNQIPDLDNLDQEYEQLIEQGKVLASEPLVVAPDEYHRFDI